MYAIFTYIWLIFMVNVGHIPYMDGMGNDTWFFSRPTQSEWFNLELFDFFHFGKNSTILEGMKSSYLQVSNDSEITYSENPVYKVGPLNSVLTGVMGPLYTWLKINQFAWGEIISPFLVEFVSKGPYLFNNWIGSGSPFAPLDSGHSSSLRRWAEKIQNHMLHV